jgi:hypothetical protein
MHSESQHYSRQTVEHYYSARFVANIKNMRFQGPPIGLRRPLLVAFVPKGSSPKGSPNLILPTLNTSSNHMVIEIDVLVCATGFSNCPTRFNNSLHELDDSDTKLMNALIDTLGRIGTWASLHQSFLAV